MIATASCTIKGIEVMRVGVVTLTRAWPPPYRRASLSKPVSYKRDRFPPEIPAYSVWLFTEQNRARWDQLLVRQGFAALERAEALVRAREPYALQAALTACHARARKAE